MKKRHVGKVAAAGFIATGLLTPLAASAQQGNPPTAQHPAAAATRPTAVTKATLRRAIVPSMCGYRSGRLVNGKLPGISPGMVMLDLSRTSFGPTIPGEKSGAVATFVCNRGGIGWPDHVVVYDAKLRPRFHLNTAKIGAEPGRQTVVRASVKRGLATINVIAAPLSGDNSLWGTAGATVSIRYNKTKKRLVATRPTIYSERSTAAALLKAISKGNRKAAARYAAPGVVSTLMKWRKERNRISLVGCYGRASLNSFYEDWLNLGERGCLVEVKWAPDYEFESGYLLRLSHLSTDKVWQRWYARSMPGVAG